MFHLKLSCLLGSLGLLVFSYPQQSLKIVNGDTTFPNALPYQVYLIFEDSKEKWECGGSLISQNYVLTAGYCTLERDGTNQKVTVYLGAHNVSQLEEENRIVMESTEIITHENLKNKQRGTDNIGLVKLPEPIYYTYGIRPISLGSREQANDSLVNVTGLISGWGSTDILYYNEPDVLHAADITIVDNNNCGEITVFNKDSQLCGANRDGLETGICDRDVGGPLVVNNTQVGIIFYSDPICDISSPEMFIKVSYYYDWIEEHSDVLIN